MAKITKIPTLEDFQNYDGLHCHILWRKVGDHWICPICDRTKYQIMRWTMRFPTKPNRFEDWVAVLHRHHDHSESVRGVGNGRFPATIVCDQCNSADGLAKRKLGLPENFSFSPDEIRYFVTATPHGKHKVSFEIARRIYEELTSVPWARPKPYDNK